MSGSADSALDSASCKLLTPWCSLLHTAGTRPTQCRPSSPFHQRTHTCSCVGTHTHTKNVNISFFSTSDMLRFTFSPAHMQMQAPLTSHILNLNASRSLLKGHKQQPGHHVFVPPTLLRYSQLFSVCFLSSILICLHCYRL